MRLPGVSSAGAVSRSALLGWLAGLTVLVFLLAQASTLDSVRAQRERFGKLLDRGTPEEAEDALQQVLSERR